MNLKLIFQLSLFGLGMAIATVFIVPSNIEPIIWLIIFSICAYFIVKKTEGKYFMHGFLTSLANCVWITLFHILFFPTYIANHPQEAEMSAKMPLPEHPRLMMLIMGPLVGIASGLILGLFSFLAGKIITKKL